MAFFELVYEIVKKIPYGKVATYGQIAKLIGAPKKAREVGWALHANPLPGIIPCHRVVDRFGRTSGSFAFGGSQEQRRLLEAEDIKFDDEGKVILDTYLWHCD